MQILRGEVILLVVFMFYRVYSFLVMLAALGTKIQVFLSTDGLCCLRPLKVYKNGLHDNAPKLKLKHLVGPLVVG